MPILLGKSLICLALICLSVTPAWSGELKLLLDKQRSHISFKARSQVTEASGRFVDYAGRLLRPSSGWANSRFDLKMNVSQVEFGAVPLEKLFLMQSLIKAIPDPLFSFVSEQVTLTSPLKLQISGIIRNGSHQHRVNVSAQILETTSLLTHLRGDLSGHGASEVGLMGEPNMPSMNYSGRIYFDLVFRQMRDPGSFQ